MKLTIFVVLVAAVVCSTMAVSPPARCLRIPCLHGETGAVCVTYTKQYPSTCAAISAECEMGQKGFHVESRYNGMCLE